MRLSVSSASVFACMSKACAPPPVGRGGSLSSVGGRAFKPDDRDDMALSVASSNMIERFIRDDMNEIDISFIGRLARVSDFSVQAKMVSNYRITKRLTADPEFQKWFKDQADKPVTRQTVVGNDLSVVSRALRRYMNETYVRTYYPPESGQKDVLRKLYEDNYQKFTGTLSELGDLLVKHAPDFSGMSGDEAIAALVTRSMIDGWATSSSTNILSFMHQRGAALLHGLGDRSMEHILKVQEDPDLNDWVANGHVDDPLLKAFARSEYETTQDWFRREGIKEMVLYRGMGYPVTGSGLVSGETVEVVANPLSSWAFDKGIVYDFGRSDDWNAIQHVVLASVFSVELIQSIPLTGSGCLNEAEVVVIGKNATALVDWADKGYWNARSE